MYSINIDKARELVDIELGGMMSLCEVNDYIDELRRQFISNSMRSYVMLIDVTNMPIQTQDMISLMIEHAGKMPKARAIAIVTGKSLAKMQIRRLFKQPYARITATKAEGMAWVLEGTEPTEH